MHVLMGVEVFIDKVVFIDYVAGQDLWVVMQGKMCLLGRWRESD